MDHLTQDLHYAVRRLFKSPGFTLVAVLTLALGIGANSAIFSVVNGVLLKPLPYPESDRLVGVYHTTEGNRAVMSGPNFTDIARAATTLESVAAISNGRMILTGEGEPERLRIAEVSASLFNVLRVRPEIGRVFNADENTPGRTNIVILSHAVWEQRFGGDSSRHRPAHHARRRAARSGRRHAARVLLSLEPAGVAADRLRRRLRHQAARRLVPQRGRAAEARRHRRSSRRPKSKRSAAISRASTRTRTRKSA